MITYSTNIDVSELASAVRTLEPFNDKVFLSTLRDSMYPNVTLTGPDEHIVRAIVSYLNRDLGKPVRLTELYRKS